jgi:hypothetical protein
MTSGCLYTLWWMTWQAWLLWSSHLELGEAVEDSSIRAARRRLTRLRPVGHAITKLCSVGRGGPQRRHSDAARLRRRPTPRPSKSYLGDLNPRPPRSRRPGDELKTLEQVMKFVFNNISTPHISPWSLIQENRPHRFRQPRI